jgi:hypothetical protein
VLRSSKYVLGVVLFAVALFFAGMSTKVDRLPLREAVIALGALFFLASTVWILTLPVTVAI